MLLRHLPRELSRGFRNWVDHLRFGSRCKLEGETFEVPALIASHVKHSIRSGEYEAAERSLIARCLPEELPVIELGGSLGIVSRFIGRRIGPDRRHVIVEANPSLDKVCLALATGGEERNCEVVSAAVDYSGKTSISFKASSWLLDSRVVPDGTSGAIRVPTVRLSDLRREHLGDREDYSLVCDIEGAEFDLFSQPREEFDGCRFLLIEIHPWAFARRGKTEAEFSALVEAHGFRLMEAQGIVAAYERAQSTGSA